MPLVACLLAEAQKTVLDHVIAMHDQLVTALCRRSCHAFEARHREFRHRAKRGLDTLLAAVEILLDPQRPRETILGELERLIDRGASARPAIAAGSSSASRSVVTSMNSAPAIRTCDAICRRPSTCPGRGDREPVHSWRGYPWCVRLDAGERPALPADAPLAFVPAAWRPALHLSDGTIHRRVWEIALGLAVRDALRCGDLFLPESRRHVSFWNLLYDDRRWDQERERAYVELTLPRAADQVLARLTQEFETVARQVDQGLGQNPFAAIRDGRLHLKRPERWRSPIGSRSCAACWRPTCRGSGSRTWSWTSMRGAASSRRFAPWGIPAPLGGPRRGPAGGVIAHGTNLGIAAMGHSAEGISVDMLQHVTQWFLREETLKAANAALVDYHHRLGLSAVWVMGPPPPRTGNGSGSRPARCWVPYPRYFGYYDRAVTVYTHTSDQYSVFGTRAICCSAREAVYVLDGLLENDTIGAARALDRHARLHRAPFGLCYLLGYSFMPRLRSLADQQLYKIDRSTSYGRLEPLFRGGVNTDLIREQWDPLVRVASSLQHRTAPPTWSCSGWEAAHPRIAWPRP